MERSVGIAQLNMARRSGHACRQFRSVGPWNYGGNPKWGFRRGLQDEDHRPGARYKTIKDLALYAQYANVKNADAATVSFNFAGPTIQPGSLVAGQKATTLNVGALFSFRSGRTGLAVGPGRCAP
jgi:hypothetical protein